MIEIVRRTRRNVKRWQSGDMCLRWTAAGMLEAEQQFRRIIGYRDLAKLALAVERDLTPARRSGGGAHARLRESITGPPPKIHGARDILHLPAHGGALAYVARAGCAGHERHS